MKFKAFLLALAVAGAGSSLALAEDGPHGTTSTGTSTEVSTTSTTTTTGEHHGDCRRVVFRGTVAGVTPTSFSVNVQQGDHGAPVSTTPINVTVTPDTWVSWTGKGATAGPAVGDWIVVWGKQCGGATGAFTAVWIRVSAPRPAGHGDSGSQGENHGN